MVFSASAAVPYSSEPVMGWQLLQVSIVKFSSANMVSSLPAWQVVQFAIDWGYGNSMACDMCTSFISVVR